MLQLRWTLYLFVTGLLLGCASSELNPNPGASSNESKTVFQPVDLRDGKVPVFIRRLNIDEPGFMEQWPNAIYVNEQLIAVIKTGSFTMVRLPPGSHEISYSFSKNHPRVDMLNPEYANTNVAKSLSVHSKVYQIPKNPTLVTMKVGFEKESVGYLQDKLTTKMKNVRTNLENYDYLLATPGIQINSTFITSEDRHQWNSVKGSGSYHRLDTYLKQNQTSPFLKEAQRERENAKKQEQESFLGAQTLQQVSDYLEKYPHAHNRDTAEMRLLTLLADNQAGFLEYQKMASRHPGMEERFPKHIKYELSLMKLGPQNLTVAKVLALSKEGLADATLAAKIRASQQSYKNFSIEEIRFLNQKGLNDKLISAMIEVTSEVERELKRAKKDAELMAQIKALIAKSQKNVPARSSLRAKEKNMPLECLKLKAAIEACDQTGGLFNAACKAVAKSNFNCNRLLK